jgi:tRNA (uracil-5-)-methyltransferase TRM9
MSTKDSQADREVFDRMAPGWYSRRHWTIFRHELDELGKRWGEGRLLNVGCGHGADFLPFRDGFGLYGLDFSREMLEFARKYSSKFGLSASLVLADAASLPFATGAFDFAIAVATYHHIREPKLRQAAVTELARVLKPGGEAFITVWNRWQPGFWLKRRDTFVRWRTREKDLYRYYHLFSRHELERLALRAGLTVVSSFAEASYRFPLNLFSRNICLLVAKPTARVDKSVV